jgi:hypothetical protein
MMKEKNTYSFKKLLSIHLQSNNPKNFEDFVISMEENIKEHDLIEIIVKIDDDDIAMNKLLEKLVLNSKINVKYISTPLLGSFADLWRSMNDMLLVCEKDTYFLWNMNDEMRIPIKEWDQILKKYVKLFPDDLYRLRTSCFRNRNYADIWECGFSPETSAITTKKWIDICGDWNPTLGPDTFNQLVAYFFSYHDRFNKNKEIRDIVINDFTFEGEGASLGLTRKQKMKRLSDTIDPWFKLFSYKILTEASRRSQKIRANIYLESKLVDKNYENPIIVDKSKKIKIIHPISKKVLAIFPYKISRIKILFRNIIRSFQYFTYAGGGVERRNIYKFHKKIFSYIYFILLKRKKINIVQFFRYLSITYVMFARKKTLLYHIARGVFHFFKIFIINIPSLVLKLPSYIIVDILVIFKRSNPVKYNSVRLKFHKMIEYFYDYRTAKNYESDATYFLSKINYEKLHKNISLIEKNISKDNFTLYVKILLISKFYNIKLENISKNYEIYENQIKKINIILSNLDDHMDSIKNLDRIIYNKWNYNLREFV